MTRKSLDVRLRQAAPDYAMLGAMLNERENEVMECVASGMTDAQIAEHCHISEGTVAYNLTAVYAQLGAINRPNAVALWYAARMQQALANEQRRIRERLAELSIGEDAAP